MNQKIKQKISGVLTILLSFSPWIAYSLLVGNSFLSKEIAIVVAIGLTLTINLGKIKKGFILDWGALVFFVILGVSIYLYPATGWVQHTSIISDLAITAIVFFSLLLRKPFTLQYAKESTPEYLWRTKDFLKVNNTITSAWGLVFLLISLFQLGTGNHWWNNTITLVVEIILYVVVIEFTKRYPDWYRAKRYWIYRRQLKPLNTRFLKENFAPITQEIFEANLKVEGAIPDAVQGIYMRNGPNPQFEPFSYYYPFDGDGMIHALYFQEGKVSYRNRFIVTPELEAERRYGQAIYPGIMDPIQPDPKLLSENCDPQSKAGNFIQVIKLGKAYLAMHETSPAYQITSDLETLGKWHPINNQRTIPINAHTRRDPITKSLYAISYAIDKPPYLTLYHFDHMGNLLEEVNIEKDYPTMIHDFLMTEHYIVIIDAPIVFDLGAMVNGKSILQWKPERGTKIALIPRNNLKQKPIWIDTEAFFAFHYANAFERNDCIEMIGAHYSSFGITLSQGIEKPPSQLTKTVIDLKTNQVKFYDLGVENGELMRINDQYQGVINRYLYMPIEHEDKFSSLVKYDDQTGEKLYRNFEGYELSEPVFVSELNAQTEDDGYVMFFAYHHESDQSVFYILQAQDFLGQPQAVIHMPQRVPNGLHGDFFRSGYLSVDDRGLE